jgi:putative membrane protein
MATSGPIQIDAFRHMNPKRAVFAILAASVAALGLLVVVIYGHGQLAGAPAWVSQLPALNAFLNGTSAVFLVLAYRAVRRKDLAIHARHMLTALAASTLFLVSYLVYHGVHGSTPFPGQGAVRPVYFFILISHIVLSAVTLPLVFGSFFFALAGRFPSHRKVATWTLPIWLYVSVTGVLVFVILRAYT